MATARMANRLRRAARRLRVALRRPLARRAPRRISVLVAGLLAIALWQAVFAFRPALVPITHRDTAAIGLKNQGPMVYFFYYLGLYPVASTAPGLEMSKAGARKALATGGSALVMEVASPAFGALRIGDHGRILLYLPVALWRGSPANPTVIPTNAVAFVLALMALFGAFWAIGRPVLGGLLVALLGSNPYALFEIYRHENVFGWPITAAILVLAAYLPLMDPAGPRGRAIWAAPVGVGLLLGTLHHVRSEAVAVLGTALLVTWFATRLPRPRRLALGAALVVTFVACSGAWRAYFTHKIKRAHDVVEAAGGAPHPFAKNPEIHHNFWMALWDGLGDFDKKYGYAWDDRKANAYAMKTLEQRYGKQPRWDGTWGLIDTHHDAKKRYPVLPFELPHYTEVMREKVLSDIRRDPGWYAEIVARRLGHVLTVTTPATLRAGGQAIAIGFAGLLFLPALALFGYARNRFYVLLLLFMLPLSLPAVLVFAKQGMTFAGVYHLFGLAALLAALAANLRWWWGRRRPQNSA
jgi:hypothetical protein